MVGAPSLSDESVDSRTHVFALCGEFDLRSAPELERKVTERITAGAERIVFDLSDVTFFDSSILGVMLAAHRRISGRPAGGLAVACSNEPVCEVFKITGLQDVLNVVPTRDEALRAVGA